MQRYSAAELRRQRDRKRARTFLVLIVLFGGVVLWTSQDYTRPLIVARVGDKLERAARKLAGPDAIDCGRANAAGNPARLSGCAEEAHANDHPFRVRFDADGKSFAVVRAPDGRVVELNWDPAGDPNVLFFGNQVRESPCVPPVLLHRNSQDVVTCLTEPGSGFLPVPVVR